MPISDEVIELAPVKKTKKTLIIMIAGMGVLFALAVAFLVMYLIKPSVTEDTNHVKDVSVNYTELFSVVENEQETLYASIGNEYTVYATVTVDDESSTNVSWLWDPALIELKEQKNEEGAYFKFIPRVGMHGRTATITACAASHVESSQKIEFTIVNQGAENIRVTQYGVAGNLQQVKDEKLEDVVNMTVPYYTLQQSENNKSIRVSFNQFGKYNSTSDEYSKLTCVDAGDSKNTGDVSVTLKESSDSTYIHINEASITSTDFYFTAQKATPANHSVEIIIQANVNNPDIKPISKTIKVKVVSNTESKYVDTMLVFNKPVVDAEFMGKVLTDGNAALLDTKKIGAEVGEDKSLKVLSGNKRFYQGSANFELVLPYNRSLTYNDLFRHVMVNPANMQYAGGNILDNWYQYIEVSSSDTNVLTVNGKASSVGAVKLGPIGLSGTIGGAAKCKLTLTDKRPGSAGAKIEIPVRIIAQTTGGDIKVSDENTVYTDLLNIDAGTGKKYDVTVTYTFVASADITLEMFLENSILNNAYTLKFDADELEVRIKGSDKTLLPDTDYVATEFGPLRKSGNGMSTQYSGDITFEVKVKKDDDGSAVFHFVKEGSYLFDTKDDSSLSKADKGFDLSASFTIVECAKWAKIVDAEEGLKVVTNNGETAGYFVRNSDTKATLYVQRQAEGTALDLISLENVKKLIVAEKSHFTIEDSKTSFFQVSKGNGFDWNTSTKVLTFTNIPVSAEVKQFTLRFNVLNVNNEVISKDENAKDPFELDIYIIDAITKIVVTNEKDPVYYDNTGNASVKINTGDVQMIRKQETTPATFKYTDVNLYYNGDTKFGTDVQQKTSKVINNDNTISFKHDTTELYVFDVRNTTLIAKTDIYAYSRVVGINFGNVELEFLLKDKDEYLGKHTGAQFSENDMERIQIAFVRKADDVALFSHANCEEGAEISYDKDKKEFKVIVNQNVDAEIYACSIVKIGDDIVYVERKSDTKGKIAPVEKASFSLPANINYTTQEGPQAGRHYFITYRSPIIEGASATYDNGGKVYYSGNSDNKLVVLVNNQTRTIDKIGFYSDLACENLISKLLFGGFINKADQYSNTVYIKVEYDALLSSHTAFEQLELALPSYLELVGGKLILNTNNYILMPSEGVSAINYKVFTCEIKLIKDEEITDNATITAMPRNHKADGKNATCSASVNAGLKKLTVKNGDNTVATVMAGTTGTYNCLFALKNKEDIKSLTLGFVYEAINSEGYDIAFDHTGAGLKVACTAINGLTVENNIQAAVSALTLKIDAANVIVLNNQKITLTFTDEYNGAKVNNVFTLEIYITVTLDIYALDFDNDTQATVTVTGSSGDDAQTLPVNVKYNGGTADTQPTAAVIAENTVLYVYTKNGEEYSKYTVGDIHVAKDGASYTLVVPNDINWRNNTFYLGLEYSGKLFATRQIIINTETCHIEFAEEGNIKLTKVDGTDYYTANVVVKSTDELFNIIANVVNDGSGNVDTGKSVNYGLYTGWDFETTASGVSITGGKFAVTAPTKITDTVYYHAQYVETKLNNKLCDLKVAITYTLAPSLVKLSGITASDLYDDTNKIITLYYYDANSYTSIDLTDYVTVANAFGVNYGTAGVTKKITSESALVGINGLTIKPLGVTDNDVTDVTVVLSATYADVTVENEYTVRIVPVVDVSFEDGEGSISLVDKTATTATATPIIMSYSGLTATYAFTADTNVDGVFTVTDNDNINTVAFANNTTAQKGNYTFTGKLNYSFDCAPFTSNGKFESTATYTVKVVGDYAIEFKLTANGSTITPYNSTEDNKYSVVGSANTAYAVTVTSDDSNLINVAYSATATNVVTVADFSGKTATVTLVDNASGAFSITVTATVGGATYTYTQPYYFMYGDNVVTKLLDNSGDELEAEQAIDYIDTPYTFKYEISGLPSDVVTAKSVNIAVNGDVAVGQLTADGTSKLYVVITATKPTTLRIGGSVQIGTRTVYLPDKTVKLTATAPSFTLSAADSVKLSETAKFTVNSAIGFKGNYEVAYAVNSTANATIDATSGVLTPKPHVLTDQTVIVTATITVSDGVYADTTYTVDKAITVKGMPLPTIKWKDSAKADIVIGNKDYSSLYAYDDVAEDYEFIKTIDITVNSTTLTSFDYSISNGILTIKNTATSGGTVTLTVTASITSGAHAGESVSDTITVRVLPTISAAVNTITLGNAKNIYDMNGAAYKSVFAPNGVNESDYSVISLSVTDSDLEVNGANLVVKNNITTAKTPVNVTATVLITEGTFKGVTLTGEKTIAFALPTKPTEKSFAWNSDNNKYNTVTLSQLSDILGNVSGTVQSVAATVDSDASDYVAITVGSGANVTLSVDKAYGAYLDGASGNKTFDVNYTVTVDGKVYYGTATYNVPMQQVTVTAKIGEETVGSEFDVKSGETVLVDLTATNGFVVNVKSATVTDNNTNLTAVSVGNGVRLTASTVTSNQSVELTLVLSVAGLSVTRKYDIIVKAPTTGAAYTANNTEINVAKGSSAAETSNWTCKNSDYKYGESVKIQISSGKLSTYFTSISLDYNSTTKTVDRNGASATVNFDRDNRNRRPTISSGLNLNFIINASEQFDITLTVTLTAYNNDYWNDYNRYGTTVTVTYRVRVIDKITVTLNTNADGETVTNCPASVEENYKGTYSNLPVEYTDSESTDTEPKRVGYKFAGWYTAQTGGTKVSRGDTVNATQSYTLYAHWTVRTYSLIYELVYEDATVSGNDKTVTYNQQYGNLPTPEKEGYDFVGWKDSAGNAVVASSIVQPTDHAAETITLTAQWKEKYCTVTLNANDGSGTTWTMQVQEGNNFTFHNTFKPTRDDYRFDGWFRAADGNTKADTAIKVTSDTTIYAHWTQLLTVQLLNFDESVIFSYKVADGDTFSEHVNMVLVDEASRFDGWFTKLSGGDKVTKEFTVTENTTLYAQWTPKYTVTLDANHGQFGHDSATGYSTKVIKGGEFSLHWGIEPTRVGYRFDGWFTKKEGGVEKTGTVIIVDSDITLYAHWTQMFTVTLDLAGGTIAGESTYTATVESGSSYSEHLNIVPTKVGYRFDGWSVTNEIENVSADTTITAQWKKLYTVSFDLNYEGANETIADREYVTGDKYGLLETPVREGYTFDGWYTDDTNGDQVTKDDVVNLTDNQTLYAHWTQMFTVTLDLAGGTIAGESTYTATVESGSTYSEHLNIVPTMEGYKFIGWSVTNEIENVSADTTITAQWKKLYTVSFNLNYTGATETIAYRDYVTGDKYGLLETPVRAGYTFDGWFTAQEGGTKINSTDTVDLTKLTLYAHWTANKYTVVLDANGGMLSGDISVEVTYDGTYGALATPTRAGYTFDGWFTAKEDGAQILSDTKVEITATQTLYAKWKAEYTVKFNSNTGDDATERTATYVEGEQYKSKTEFTAEPTNAGKTFVGWAESDTATEDDCISGETVVTGSVTLYAVWKTTEVTP